MKKFLYTGLFLITTNASAQTNEWFISVYSGYVFGGPSLSIKSQMKDQGYQSRVPTILGGFSNYPEKTHKINALLMAGKRLSQNRSIFLISGLTENARIKGNRNGNSDYPSWTNEALPVVQYKVWQVSTGFLYSSSRLGIGPSVFMIQYQINDEKKINKITAGATLLGRVPLGKARQPIGIELVILANLAPPVKMKTTNETPGHYEPGKANMVLVSMGLAVSVRSK